MVLFYQRVDVNRPLDLHVSYRQLNIKCESRAGALVGWIVGMLLPLSEDNNSVSVLWAEVALKLLWAHTCSLFAGFQNAGSSKGGIGYERSCIYLIY